jgi:hypothetical protein
MLAVPILFSEFLVDLEEGLFGTSRHSLLCLDDRSWLRNDCQYILFEARSRLPKLTWISNADSDVSSTHICAVESECLLQAFNRAKFDVSKSFRLAVHLVLDYSNTDHIAVREEVRDVALGCVE